ncbi:MAG: class I SAM-dependent RNA methyltransferase [Burkholderiaceae bacterium]|nr:class I SAM-dependent RNA methyltransferase [Burkholderiaceae bacterium]
MHLFAPCPRGLEDLLSRELAIIGARGARVVPGGVSFEGDLELVYLVNLYSRLASRVLRQVGAGRYRDEEEIFRVARRVEWDRFMHCRQTLRVDTTAVRSPLRSLNFANLKVKDAVIDRLRETQGDRPSIDTIHPDVRVFSFLNESEITLYIDTSGESLFKRGWRREREDKGIAPLKENLAAGLLALAGWTPDKPLYDPYCGSGTLLIEAAQLALGIAPGLSRPFAFEQLGDHDAALWAALRGDAIREAQQHGKQAAATLQIHGSDIDPIAIEQATRNLARAGVADAGIQLRLADAGQVTAPTEVPGIIVTNPPYGERMDAQDGSDEPRAAAPAARTFRLPASARRDAQAQAPGGSASASAPGPAPALSPQIEAHRRAMAAFGQTLKANFGGWQVYVLSSDKELPRQLGIKETRKTPLFNGALECRLFRFDVFDRSTRAVHDKLHAERHAQMRAAEGAAPAARPEGSDHA